MAPNFFMITEDQVYVFKKELVKLQKEEGNEKQILDILKQLETFTANAKFLSKSEMGLVVGRLRKYDNEEVVWLSKEVVKKWKHDIEKEKINKIKGGNDQVGEETALNAVEDAKNSEETGSNGIRFSSDTNKLRTVKAEKLIINHTGSLVRDKSIEMLFTGLASNTDAKGSFVVKLAESIELKVFEMNSHSESDAYKEKIRTLFMNLKNPDNSSFKMKVLNGKLSVEKLSSMTAEDFKSKDMLLEEQKIREDNIFKARGAQAQESETDQFKCGKCKQRKCRYYQMQTRSADEPMTTFVTCVNCGNKWKFCYFFIVYCFYFIFYCNICSLKYF